LLRAAIATAGAVALVRRAASAATLFEAVPDRELIARARAEKSVSLYLAMSASDLAKLAQGFGEISGIEPQALGLSGRDMAPRLQLEQRGGRFEADVSMTTGYDTDLMKRSGLLAPFHAPETRDFLPGYFDRDGYWAAGFTLTDVIMFNTAKLAANGLAAPAAWADFTRPAWRGKFAIFAGSVSWYAALRRALGATAAEKLVRALGANAPIVTATRQLAADGVASGEFLGALAVFGYEADRLKQAGQPVDFVNAPPTVAEMTTLALVKNAPHPNAARLFIRWLTSRPGQEWMVANIGRISARKDVANNPRIWNPRLRITLSDPGDTATYNDDLHAFDGMFGIPG
jgi:iron(III) transport system substrate-binding protein